MLEIKEFTNSAVGNTEIIKIKRAESDSIHVIHAYIYVLL